MLDLQHRGRFLASKELATALHLAPPMSEFNPACLESLDATAAAGETGGGVSDATILATTLAYAILHAKCPAADAAALEVTRVWLAQVDASQCGSDLFKFVQAALGWAGCRMIKDDTASVQATTDKCVLHIWLQVIRRSSWRV